MSTDPRTLARTYFEAWRTKDFDRLRSVLADDVTFRGPLGTADGIDECLQGLRGMAQMMTGLEIKVMAVDGDDVITWFDLSTEAVGGIPTANWSHVQDGKIAAIRAAFDARELAATLRPHHRRREA
jgi:ketosteroid isomerase-like protein